jgi:hypothetical protein
MFEEETYNMEHAKNKQEEECIVKGKCVSHWFYLLQELYVIQLICHHDNNDR